MGHMTRFPITKYGYEKLQAEIKQLKTIDRPEVIQAIAEARELGDLSENAEYHAARERQGFIEGRIMDLEDKFARSEIIDPTKINGTTVKFGAKILLIEHDTDKKIKLHIVGEYEADLSQGMISLNSPIARAAIGKEAGDSIEVQTPAGSKTYDIEAVVYE
jgi:transcription elongation factor GreA